MSLAHDRLAVLLALSIVMRAAADREDWNALLLEGEKFMAVSTELQRLPPPQDNLEEYEAMARSVKSNIEDIDTLSEPWRDATRRLLSALGAL